MPSFPKIDSPCPLKWNSLPGAGRDFCTVCRRRVHNLDAMTTPQRREFLAACRGAVCVAYTVRRPRRPVIAAAALGLAAALSFTAAQAIDAVPATSDGEAGAAIADASDDATAAEIEAIMVLGGVFPIDADEQAGDDESFDEEADDDGTDALGPFPDDQGSYSDAEFVAAPEDETPR